MKQAIAYVTVNKEILPGLKRPHGRDYLGTHIVWLHCPEIAREAKPGQYVMVRCGELSLPRPFSIHQANDTNIALFCVVLEDGKGTNWLSQRRENDNVELFGPLGNGFSILPEAHNLLLVAGGNGIAPLCFLATKAIEKGHSVTVLYGSPNKDRHVLPPEVKVIAVTEDGSVGKKGRVTDFLPDFASKADQIFACGPLAMYKDMYARRKELLKGKPVQVSLEVRMGCGRGVCYGCTIKTKHGLKMACQDGPVFDLDDVLWDEPIC